MTHPLLRAVAAGAAAFAATTAITLAVSAQLSGWQAPARLEPLSPEAPDRVAPSEVVPITRSDVSFSTDGATTAGVLTTPRDGADVGIVLVGGSGPGDRRLLQPLAERIAEVGIAVLTYDKRTAGYSAFERDYLQLARDASAAADALRATGGISRVGALGLSEGGWVVSAAAAHAEEPLDFLVLASAPIVSPLEQASWIADSALRGAPMTVRRASATLLAQGPSILDYLDFDPRPLLARIQVPVFAVWGADDATVPVNEAYRRLRSMLPSDLTAHIAAGVGHDLAAAPETWLRVVTRWVVSPSGDGLTGREPASAVGVACIASNGPLGDPRVHLPTSAAVAAIAGAAVWRRSTPRREANR